MAKMLDGPQ